MTNDDLTKGDRIPHHWRTVMIVAWLSALTLIACWVIASHGTADDINGCGWYGEGRWTAVQAADGSTVLACVQR